MKASLMLMKCVSNVLCGVCYSECLWSARPSAAQTVPRLLSVRCHIQWLCSNSRSSAGGADPDLETSRLSCVKVGNSFLWFT